MEKTIPTLSFSNFDSTTNKIESARQAASSAFSSAFNVVSIKSNMSATSSSSSSSTNVPIDESSTLPDLNEDTLENSKSKSNNFFRVLSLNKAVNIIQSLPSSTSSKKNLTNSKNSLENSSAYLQQTASSVLSKINPFEQQVQPDSTTEKSNLKKFFFSAAASFSVDITDRRFSGAYQENDVSFDESSLDVDYNEQILEVKRKTKPIGSIEYEVAENDTIEKIALKFNTIPSEILHMNRLVTRTIFAKQKIYVPDPNYIPPPPPPPVTEEPKSPSPPALFKQLSLNETEKTPKTEKNQPNTSNSGGFSFLRWKTNSKPGHVEAQKSVDREDGRRASLSRHMLSEEDAKKLDEECMQRFLKINCKIVTRSKGCYDGVLIITPSAIMFDPLDSSAVNAAITEETNETTQKTRTASTSSSNSIYDEASAIIPIEIISNIIMYEDLALKEVQEYFDYQEVQEFLSKEVNNFIKCENDDKKEKSSAGSHHHHVTFNIGQSIPEVSETIKSDEQSAEKENEIVIEIDNDSSQLKAEEQCGTSDLVSCYLCVKVNNNKDFLMCPLDRKMKNRLRSEFWFQINDNRYQITDKIFAFFLEWKSDPTFSLSNSNDSSKPTATRRFQVVKPHENLTDLIDQSLKADLHKGYSSTNRLLNRFDTFTKDWEMVNLQELELKLKTEKEIEKEYKTLPTLMNESLILKEEHLRKLNVNLIPRAIGYNWVLTFSTEEHGFSINTLYRKLAEVEGPCLIVVKDTSNNVFGAMSSTKLFQSEHFYGTGESFLFTFTPTFKVFKWTGENNFFTRGTNESISFGVSDSHHGLWFDGDLLNGHTQKSKTYDNDLLTTQENFTIASLEVWTFSD